MRLGDVHVLTGTANNDVNSLITRTALSRHTGTQSYKGAAAASRVLDLMNAPAFIKPAQPIRPIFKASINNAMKEVMVAEYNMETQEGNEQNKAYLVTRSKWKDNEPKVYNPVIQHCYRALVLKIIRQSGWETRKE